MGISGGLNAISGGLNGGSKTAKRLSTRAFLTPKERNISFVRSAAAHKARCLKDEPGTLQFEILLPKDDDTKVLSYEVYRDDAAFEVHRNGPSLAQWREETAGMMVKLHGVRCAVVD